MRHSPAVTTSRALASLVLALSAWGCDRPATPEQVASHSPPCPEGAIDLPARAEVLVRRLGSVPEGAEVLQDTLGRRGRTCFAPGSPAVVVGEGTLLLDGDDPELESAARLGHLLHHVRAGLPYPAEGVAREADCDAVVRLALDREAPAWALELRLRAALGVTTPVRDYPFEAAYWRAPEAEREALVRAYFDEHPGGGGDVDGLAAAYRARCESERAGRGRR